MLLIKCKDCGQYKLMILATFLDYFFKKNQIDSNCKIKLFIIEFPNYHAQNK